MQRILIVILALSGAASAENLLANPGFEELKGGQAAAWNLYVMPQTGSWGRLDEEAPLNGKYSACLHIATPYIVDPLNNWSQNIVQDVRGAELVVRGNIKTDDAAEAAIWLQCFRKSPLATLDVAISSDTTSMRGTKDWTPIEMKLKVPSGTDFVVCRCVLKGSGTAWFDDLSVEKAAPEQEAPLSKDAPLSKAPPSATKPVPTAKPLARAPVSAPSGVGKAAAMPAPKAKEKDKGPAPDDTQKSYKELLESNRELTKSNQEMREQIKRLNEQVQSLRQVIQRGTQMGLTPLGSIPPLVPHGLGAEEGF